jgi:hypothetical protein
MFKAIIFIYKMKCEYCKHTFTTKTSLNHHQRTAKYCLKIRGEVTAYKYTCDGCDMKFHKIFNLNRHSETCKSNDKVYTYMKKVKDLETENKENKNENKSKDILICKLEKQVKELQDQLGNIARDSAKRPTYVQNNRVDHMVNNLLPVTEEHLKDQAQYLTLDHVKQGASGYAKYALDYPLKNRIVCVDYSRRKIKYKNKDGELICDPEMAKLSQKLFTAIEERNDKLVNEYVKELTNKWSGLNNNYGDEMDEDDTKMFEEEASYLIDFITNMKNRQRDVKKVADGYKPEIYHDFIGRICSNTVAG